ncbi:hypothetical protein RJT34_33551 [Clitoria ternatea]|uniref:Uncharacterized protein n=1 Tax=Clitoria ternatea TaxID=43366 RepID=A0AAN9EZ36_CLITE
MLQAWPLANTVVFGMLLSDDSLLSLWGLLLCGLLLHVAVRDLNPQSIMETRSMEEEKEEEESRENERVRKKERREMRKEKGKRDKEEDEGIEGSEREEEDEKGGEGDFRFQFRI